MTPRPAGVAPDFAVVVPTVNRPSLRRLLDSLSAQDPAPVEVVVADDRGPGHGLPDPDVRVVADARIVRSGGRGPAAARNAGWRCTSARWVVTVDDDVVLPEGWSRRLADDLAAHPHAGAVAGRITVPAPAGRRPTDWERTTAGLRDAWWATADMAFRRAALVSVGGFDERFPRAYREDADIALRLRQAGWPLAVGSRHVVHPVRPADRWVSVRAQRGNADDALMRALHGRHWRRRARCPRGRLRWHAATVAAAGAALLSARAGWRRTAAAGALAWAGLTADFTRRRVAPGPGGGRELVAMAVTSAVIPPAALWWRAAGAWRHRRAHPWSTPVRAVLLDRDGTLVHDVPYNGDPTRVTPVDGAAEALRRLRTAGLRVGLVTNQSGVGRGILTASEVDAVHERLSELVGGFDTVQVCPHRPEHRCPCRKPAAGLVQAAARAVGVAPQQTVVIGDIGADVEAALAAGARAVLVPTAVTRPEEVLAAPVVAASLLDAVDRILDGRLE